MILLKAFQRLGYFPQPEQRHRTVVNHLRSCLKFPPSVWVIPALRSRRRYEQLIRAYLQYQVQIASKEWRQPAGLLTILQGQMGAEAFLALLKQRRDQIIALIGVDGYDHIPQLLEECQRSVQ